MSGPIGSACYLPDDFGDLACLCWCGARVLLVPAVEVRAGHTRTCSRNCYVRSMTRTVIEETS